MSEEGRLIGVGGGGVSGIGISIAANKVKGVRAALCFTKGHAEMSRKHNDSNVLALGARMKGGDEINNDGDDDLSERSTEIDENEWKEN